MSTKRNVTIFILIVCIVLGAVFTGCNAAKDEVVEDNYDFSVFLGSLDEPIEIDAMLTKYEEKYGLKIKPIVIPQGKDNQATLEDLLSEPTPPALYAVSNDIDKEWLSSGGFIADFNTIDSTQKGNRRPYILDGYGFAYDKVVFEEIFGSDKYETLIEDLKACSYAEWTGFLSQLDNYIKDKKTKSFKVNGHKYSLPKEKGTDASKLNGVFAFPGADSEIYGYSLMNMVIQTADLNAWETAKQTSTASLQTMNPTITTYIEGVNLITSYLAGTYSSGIRGSDLTNEELYSKEMTNEMFMSGKSMFSIIDSSDYSEIQKLNAKKAETLSYLPIKMPYDPTLGNTATDGSILNSSIPANVSYSLYINNQLPKETQKQALDFLEWFMKKEKQWGNPLSSNINEYVKAGNILEYNYEPESIKKWEEDVFGEKGFRVFLRKELWSDEYKDGMKEYFVEKWCEE